MSIGTKKSPMRETRKAKDALNNSGTALADNSLMKEFLEKQSL